MKIAKRVVLALLVLVVLFAGVMAAILVPVFSGILPIDADKELAPGIRQIKDGYTSVVVIDGGNGSAALIDCGNDASGAAIMAALKAHNLTPDNVGAIFLTHGHPDHTAACRLFPKAEVYAFLQDALLASGQEKGKGMLPSMAPATPEEKRIKVTKPLTDGQDVAVGSLSVRALFTPGHTGGSASYLVNGVLCLGDNATAKNDGIHQAPKPFSDDVAQNRDSLGKLYEKMKADGSVKTLEFAHSGPVQGLDALKDVKE